jgi:hypothetical protein
VNTSTRISSGVNTGISTVSRGLSGRLGSGALGPDVTVGSLLAQLPSRLRLGTRRSALARTQSRWVADQLGSATRSSSSWST